VEDADCPVGLADAPLEAVGDPELIPDVVEIPDDKEELAAVAKGVVVGGEESGLYGFKLMGLDYWQKIKTTRTIQWSAISSSWGQL